MMEEPARRPQGGSFGFEGSEGSEPDAYRAVSGLALTGLLLGLLAGGATIWPVFWIVPPLGILLSVLALRRIAHNAPALSGRNLALAGLLLSVFFTAAVPTGRFAYRWQIRRQGRQFAAIWFDCLQSGQAIKAYQLSLDSRYRQPMRRLVEQTRVAGSEARTKLEEYVKRPEIRCLLALGDRAQVRCFATEAQYRAEGRETTMEVYTVTYEEAGEKKTFFLLLGLRRYVLPGTGMSDWYVASSEGGYRPESLGGVESEEWGVES